MIYDFLFTFLMMIFDGIISIIFKNDYALMTPIFIPGLTTCTLMLITREMNYRKAIEFSISIGLIMAIFEPNNIWSYVICYLIVTLVVKLWSISISDSLIEQIILCVLAIFIKEIVIYFSALLYGNTNISLLTWVYKVLFKTIVYNFPLIIFCIYINKRRLEIKSELLVKKKKKEKVFWGD